jgi:NAD(P)-dependent dehydrogenase (short-subunit alcohol dehydrogenase family)
MMSTTPDAELFGGRTAVVTGAARGLGLAMATALARSGASIALLDRLETVGAAASALSAETGVRAIGVNVDVTDPASVQRAFAQVAESLCTASVLVNSAGITSGDSALETSPELWSRVLDVNVTGTFLVSREFAARAIDAKLEATVINIASMSSFVVNVPQTQTPYNVSKAAVAMLTKSLAIGYFASDMTRDFVAANPEMAEQWVSRIPAGRMGEPHELGDLLVYLASERSAYVVGQNFVIDGGYTVV